MIRQAVPEDAPQLAQLTIMAMGELAYKFVNNREDALPLFERFAGLKGNQYSYENMLVWDNGGVQGMINAYNGAHLKILRDPFVEYLSATYDITIHPEDETQPGEYYIDCLAVFPNNQGKGIGKKLIASMADHAAKQGHQNLGLIVNKDNSTAKKLYTGLGFQVVGDKHFIGDVYDHLQMEVI